MKKYESEPHVPPWISALNGKLLSSAELDVLDFISWCKKHGCRTSNRRIGSYTHWSRETVKRAVQKLYRLDLIAIDNYGKRTRTLKPVQWTDREQWEKYRILQTKLDKQDEKTVIPDKKHPGQNEPHISSLDKSPPTGVSRLEEIVSTFQVDDFLPEGCRPQPPACGSVGSDSSEISATPAKPDIFDDYKARVYYDKLLDANWKPERAKSLTLRKFPDAKF